MIKDILKMSGCFPGTKSLRGTVKVELCLSNYASKSALKNETGFDSLTFAKKVNFAGLKFNSDQLDIDKSKNVSTNLSDFKSKAGKLDVDKLATGSVDLSKLSDVINNAVLKNRSF